MAMAARSHSQPDKQKIDMATTTPPITVALRLLTRFPFSIPLPLTFPNVSLLILSLSFPVWNKQLHRHTPACYLMHMHQKKKTGERGPRLSQSQTTWRPVTGLPTKSTHCTVWVWVGDGEGEGRHCCTQKDYWHYHARARSRSASDSEGLMLSSSYKYRKLSVNLGLIVWSNVLLCCFLQPSVHESLTQQWNMVGCSFEWQ